ncbi:MAG: hypothetical protein ABEJ31_13000 [Haloarculaceae archaeon]
MPDRRCPDCDEAMERVVYGIRGGFGLAEGTYVRPADGSGSLLDRLGVTAHRPVSTWQCPDCGLLRQYATPGETEQ